MSVYKRGKVFYMDFVINGERTFKTTGRYTKKEAKQIVGRRDSGKLCKLLLVRIEDSPTLHEWGASLAFAHLAEDEHEARSPLAPPKTTQLGPTPYTLYLIRHSFTARSKSV